MDIPTSVATEISELRENFPQIKIQTATDDFLTGSYERTSYARVKFTLTFPSGYPDHPLIIDIASDKVVPPGLKKKLEKDLSKDLPLGHYQQIILVLNKLVQFVDGNKFLPCWKELKQCINSITPSPMSKNSSDGATTTGNTTTKTKTTIGSSISIIENKGKIKLKLCKGKYYYQCSILIDDGYPSTSTHEDWGKACNLTFLSSNFPSKIEFMLTNQAKELVRRLQDGMSAEEALQFSNPIKAPKNIESSSTNKEVKVRLTQQTLKGLKEDIDTLARVRDLREVDSATNKHNAKQKANLTKDRKDARRTIRKITGQEIAKDEEIEEQEKKWAQDEQARIAGYNISEHDGSNPQPSLLPLVHFLREKIQQLPDVYCPKCHQHTLPSDPDELKALYIAASECKTEKEKKKRKETRKKRPVRTYCGHWWHYNCLEKYMTEPPFGASCPADECGRRVYHPDFPDDMKQLERQWAMHQARLREIEDAGMFL